MTVTPDATAAGPAESASSPTPSLRSGSLGTTDIAFFVVSAAAPLTVMAGVAPLAILMGGIGAPVGYLLAGLTLAVFAVGFTTMSRHVRSAGAFYAYITRGLGRRAGIGAALLALIGYNGMEIGVYGLLGTATRDTAHSLFGADIPWLPVSLVGLLLIGWAGYRSIDFGAKLLGVLLVAETGILVLLAGECWSRAAPTASPRLLRPGQRHGLRHGGRPGLRVRRVHRLRVHRHLPPRGPRPGPHGAPRHLPRHRLPRPVLRLHRVDRDPGLRRRPGHRGGRRQPRRPVLLRHHDLRRTLGGRPDARPHRHQRPRLLLAFHNAINRYGLALAEEGILPKALARVHPCHRSPYVAGLAQTVLGAIVVLAFAAAGADPYMQLLLWVNTPGMLALMLLQLLAALAVPFYFRRVTHSEGVLRTVVAPVTAAVLLAGAITLVVSHLDQFTGASPTVNTFLAALVPTVLVIGLVLARWLRRARPEVYANFAAEPPAASGD